MADSKLRVINTQDELEDFTITESKELIKATDVSKELGVNMKRLQVAKCKKI